MPAAALVGHPVAPFQPSRYRRLVRSTPVFGSLAATAALLLLLLIDEADASGCLWSTSIQRAHLGTPLTGAEVGRGLDELRGAGLLATVPGGDRPTAPFDGCAAGYRLAMPLAGGARA